MAGQRRARMQPRADPPGDATWDAVLFLLVVLLSLGVASVVAIERGDLAGGFALAGLLYRFDISSRLAREYLAPLSYLVDVAGLVSTLVLAFVFDVDTLAAHGNQTVHWTLVSMGVYGVLLGPLVALVVHSRQFLLSLQGIELFPGELINPHLLRYATMVGAGAPLLIILGFWGALGVSSLALVLPAVECAERLTYEPFVALCVEFRGIVRRFLFCQGEEDLAAEFTLKRLILDSPDPATKLGAGRALGQLLHRNPSLLQRVLDADVASELRRTLHVRTHRHGWWVDRRGAEATLRLLDEAAAAREREH